MNVSVLTPDRTVFEGEISSLKVPGVSGSFEILNNHAPIVSALVEGQVKLTEANGEIKAFKIEKGFVEVLRNNVSLLVQGVEE